MLPALHPAWPRERGHHPEYQERGGAILSPHSVIEECENQAWAATALDFLAFSTVLPAYEPQAQMRCGRVGSLQAGQVMVVVFSSLLPAAKRRMLRRLRETFFF